MRSVFGVVVTALLLLGVSADSAAEGRGFPTQVATWQGPVQGFLIEDFSTVAWLGVPYAQPPVDSLRWKAPRDPALRSGVLDASAYGSRCLQGSPASSEDCLYLNV